MISKPDQRTSAPNDAASMDPIGPHGADTPSAGGAVLGGGGEDTAPLNFDDDEIYSGRSKEARSGGTMHSKGGDSGRVGAPIEQLSDSNGPSDPDRRS